MSLEQALEDALYAKSVYRDEPRFAENRQAHKDAAAELRYQRWVARGGPALVESGQDPSRPSAAHYERWLAETKG